MIKVRAQTTKILKTLLIVLAMSSCQKEEEIVEKTSEGENPVTIESDLNILANDYVIDESLGLFLFNATTTDLDSLMLVGQDTVALTNLRDGWPVGGASEVGLKGKTYIGYRTELPLIRIATDGNEIVDEPKVLGKFDLIEKGGLSYSSNAGVELRGLASLKFPKKSYNVELWDDDIGDDTDNEPLLGLRNDDDWILDGLWNEPLRIRDYTAWRIWLEMGRYPYSDQKQITLGIKQEFVELVVNDSYKGIYYLGEKVDRKQLDLVKNDSVTRGELYKGDAWRPGTLFTGNSTLETNRDFWNGYEREYPDEPDSLSFRGLHELIDLVVEGDDIRMEAEISNRVHIQNAADYFIFMNLIHIPDNTGRNLYTAKYDQNTPYFFVPWDMDGSFGNNSKGERINYTFRILGNGLFERLLTTEVFVDEVKDRWALLKTDVLSVERIQAKFDASYRILLTSGAYNRERLSNDLPFTNVAEGEIEFIKSFVSDQWDFLDAYIGSL